MRTVSADATSLYSDHTQEARVLSPLSLLRNPSTLLETKLILQVPRSVFCPSGHQKAQVLPCISHAAGGSATTLPTPGLCFHKNSMFLYSLLKSAAIAVLKILSAVIAIAHVLSVCIKSLSVSTILPEYSFSKLKYDSTILPMSDFLGSSSVPASKSPISLLFFCF